MEMSRSGPNVKRLIMVPALIALAITIVRLVGELAGGSSALFSSEADGGGALVGIVWLVPIFGVYFAIKLVRQGFGPESAGKVIGLAVLGLVAAVAIVLPVILITGDPNAGVSLVPRSINMVTFVASATASSSRSNDDAMSVTSWRRSDKEIDAVPPPPFGLMEVPDDLCVARRRRCPCIASSSRLDLVWQDPSANAIVFMERDT